MVALVENSKIAGMTVCIIEIFYLSLTKSVNIAQLFATR